MCISTPGLTVTVRMLLAIAVSFAVAAQHTAAQVVSDTLPAGLLLRAASAANHVRTGGVVFVAACRQPQRILGVFTDRAGAIGAAEHGGASCLVVPMQSEPASATEDPVPASLAFRWAEAADAFRTGQPVWVEAELEYPHIVRGIYTNPDSARLSELTALSGPLITMPDFGGSVARSLPCPHLKIPFSRYPPDCMSYTGIPSMTLDSILDMTLEVRVPGHTYTWTFSPEVVDAIFFSMSAFDRFVAPYYARSYGVDFAQQLREALRPGWLGIAR